MSSLFALSAPRRFSLVALAVASAPLAGCGTTIVDTTPDPAQEVPEDLWSKRFGDAGPQVGTGIAVGATGQVTIAGYFGDTVDLEKGPLANQGQTDLFVGAFDEDGHPLWSESFGGPGGDSVPGRTFVGADAKGRLTLVAPRAGAVDFGLWPIESEGVYDLVVAGLDPAGKPLWNQRFGAPERYTLASSMAVHPNGNIVIAGNFSGTVDFGKGALVNTQPTCTACANAAFVVELDAFGNTLWARSFQSDDWPAGQVLPQVAFDAAGDVVLAGSFAGKVPLGDGALPLVSTGASADLFMIGLGPTGKVVWRTSFDGQGEQWIANVATDASGRIALTGNFDGSVDFGGGPLVAKGPTDVFVATFDSIGQPLWSQGFGGDQKQAAPTGTFAEDGNLVVMVPFRGPLDLGTGPLQGEPGASALVARFGPSGEAISGVVLGKAPSGQGPSHMGPPLVALDGPDRLLLTGGFDGALDFGSGALESHGDKDVFLARTSF